MNKAILLTITAMLTSVCGMAQDKLMFPFQGGKTIMTRFFNDSLIVSPEIIKKKAAGIAVLKFTADDKGSIKKIIIYYADDYILTKPVIEALRRSDHRWIIPDNEKFHDFIVPFSISFNPPASGSETVQKDFYNYYSHRRPVFSFDQVPLDMATLLPTVIIHYDIPQ